MTTLFNVENSDSEDKLTINSNYANNYNSWRQKEELNKLKTKYGDHIKNLGSDDEESSETSSEEDEEGVELTEEMEKKFYNTLACLKNKDPKIYDERVTFFEESKKSDSEPVVKREKEKKLFLRDYERRMVIERGGKFSDSEDEETQRSKKREQRGPTYVEEQMALKASISKVLNDEDDDEDDNDTGFLVPKKQTEEQKLKSEETYREWLKGQKSEIDSSERETLKPLRDFWTDPNLDPKEKFLRDYILNKKFMDKDDDGDDLDYECVAHDSDVDLSEDEKNIEKQEEFEHKYNFRFEEPDQEFIKRYPRTMENSLRKKDTRRSTKRAEIKQRKEEDKIRKKEELKQLKALKRKEIADKIAQLKEITGNDDMQFDIDLDADFDPAEHDRKMQEIFNDDYYAEPEDLKPEFPDVDEELGIERTWDDYDPDNEEFVPDEYEAQAGSTHCEDPEFNMDADYDPTKAHQSELIESTRKRKKRRRSKFAEVIAKEKPKFNPELHSSYRDYIEQYYALDYEDMIDDLPCRFKYRKVVPNDYGLSVEEILMADDRELQKWCSLKKALEHKPENIELNEVRIYQQKAKNEAFKKKVLKSLYTPEEEPQDPETAVSIPDVQNDDSGKKKRKKKKKKSNVKNIESSEQKDSKFDVETKVPIKNGDVAKEKVAKLSNGGESIDEQAKVSKKPKENIESKEISMQKTTKRKIGKKVNSEGEIAKLNAEEPKTKKFKMDDTTLTKNLGDSPKIVEKKKKNNKKSKDEIQKDSEHSKIEKSKNLTNVKRAKKKNKKIASDNAQGKKMKKNSDKTKKEIDQVALLSSERLKAYGLNPKKFKNKLKYGKKK